MNRRNRIYGKKGFIENTRTLNPAEWEGWEERPRARCTPCVVQRDNLGAYLGDETLMRRRCCCVADGAVRTRAHCHMHAVSAIVVVSRCFVRATRIEVSGKNGYLTCVVHTLSEGRHMARVATTPPPCTRAADVRRLRRRLHSDTRTVARASWQHCNGDGV